MTKLNYLKEVAFFHIDSFNYVIKQGLQEACLNIDPVYTKTENPVKICICEAELTPLQLPMDTRKHKRTVYPSEARLRHVTYFAELHLTLKFETSVEELYVKRIFFVPLMLKSDLCLLKDLNDFQLCKHKEDENDPGGYFIVKGKERLIRLFVVPKRNYPLALIQDKWKKLKLKGCTEYGIFIASVKDHHSRSDLYLHFVKITDESQHASVAVRVYYKRRSYFIPFILLVKSLVDESDASILREILKFKPDDIFLKQCLIGMMQDMLYSRTSDSVSDPNQGVHSHEGAKRVLGEVLSSSFVGSPKATFCDITDHFLKKNVLIHLSDNEEKFKFLCFSIFKLFSLVQNECREDDLDNPVFQEVLSPGQTFLSTVKEGASTFLNSVKNSLGRKIKSADETTFTLSQSIAQGCTNRAISLTPIVERMVSTGNMPGTDHGLICTTGFTIPVGRTNVLETASQFVGVHKFTMKFYAKNMRKYYPESWGFLCPAQTPEGENTGLYNYLASQCQVVPLSSKEIEADCIYKSGVIPFFDPITYNKKYPKMTVFVDGKLLGWTKASLVSRFIKKLKHLRSIEKVPSHTEIVFVPKSDPQMMLQGIYIFSSSCRLVRFLETVDKEELLGIYEQQSLKEPLVETNKSGFLGMAPLLLPFGENNPGIRNIFTCMKSKQAVSFPFSNSKYRADTKSLFLTYPQSPLISTAMYNQYNWADYPTGTNVTIAVISYSGYDMEDAIVLNQASIDRGLMHTIEYKTCMFDFKSLARELGCTQTELDFKCDPKDPDIQHFLDPKGRPHVGNIVKFGSPILSVYSTKSKKFLIKKYESKNSAYIDSVTFLLTSSSAKRLPEETKKVSITYRLERIPVVGDKFSNRHGQKGVCGAILPPEDLPFTIDGSTPDILFNPHGLPSRMSIGMCLEILASKAPIDRVPKHAVIPFKFSGKNSAVDYFGDLLKEAGMDAYGQQTFYSGTSGEELEAQVFCGSLYYMRLHHFVDNKYQVQSIPQAVDPKTQQPINLDKDGAIRFGEMERDSLLAHGAMFLLQDRLLLNSDACEAYICKKCKTLLYPDLQSHDPLERNMNPRENKYCKMCDEADAFKVLSLPAEIYEAQCSVTWIPKQPADCGARKSLCPAVDESGLASPRRLGLIVETGRLKLLYN
ncbi:hypothetical protein JTE90_018308 [Oedothorax gibbosus]|uniref:DNA-directed RNA polymerase subunit beta n=1 Tax=Oedothorax gibbosus TaxID=931172 RepID=A0AAV6UDH9_9ARAC|nr:hypothetical protein JTE90_018308 [Oedothorax gibbosus]